MKKDNAALLLKEKTGADFWEVMGIGNHLDISLFSESSKMPLDLLLPPLSVKKKYLST